jgi:pimeloyl-ACP methyl ester carboxylesterase
MTTRANRGATATATTTRMKTKMKMKMKMKTASTRATSSSDASSSAAAAKDEEDDCVLATKCARMANFVYKGGGVESWMADDGLQTKARGVTGATGWCVCDDVERNARFIVVRGAAWSQPDTDRNKLSWQIAKIWPQALRKDRKTPVVCHQGVYEMVEEFWRDLVPWLSDETFDGTYYFTGHSLGGSMGLVVAARARELGLEEARVGGVYTFGAPPVLAYDRLAGNGPGSPIDDEPEVGMDEILRLVGFTRGASLVKQYVLAKDVIPRMWLSADPVFVAATKTDFIGGLLDWRRETFGEGMFTKNRFLYESIGDLYWLEYADGEQGKPTLSRYGGDDVLTKLRMNLDDITQSPLTAWQTIGDHNSQAYVDALQFLTIRRVINPSKR